MDLLDREGIDGLSMRNLADQLGVGATTLYWHVASRRELIALVVNEIYGEIQSAGASSEEADWRASTWQFAREVTGRRPAPSRGRFPCSITWSVIRSRPTSFGSPNTCWEYWRQAGFDLREAERALSTISCLCARHRPERSRLAHRRVHGTDRTTRPGSDEMQRLAETGDRGRAEAPGTLRPATRTWTSRWIRPRTATSTTDSCVCSTASRHGWTPLPRDRAAVAGEAGGSTKSRSSRRCRRKRTRREPMQGATAPTSDQSPRSAHFASSSAMTCRSSHAVSTTRRPQSGSGDTR